MAPLRASDEDRERTVAALHRATTLGYLNLQEFEDRLDGVYRAAYLRDLDTLLADLPGAPRPSSQWSPSTRWSPSSARVRSASPARAPRPFRWSPLPLTLRVGLGVLLAVLALAALAQLWFPPLPLIIVGVFFWRRGHHRHCWGGRAARWPAEFA